MRVDYPFSEVVGQEELKLALLLVAVDPTIGGVLIKGERGTAKSTIARGLAALLPPRDTGEAAPFIELPLGATEDRVVGSLDVTKALRDGDTELRSGVLARADGGVLYVDEVNLLPDHLVDLLLDAAARGWVTVERDGLSAGEAARFVLIGTMNPEEGELRPQFLDRFGLCVQVRGLLTQELRMAAVRKRLAFDRDPAAAMTAAQPAQEALRRAVLSARNRLSTLQVTNSHLSAVATICSDQRLEGIRGDLAIIKAARALAAWRGCEEILLEHIQQATELALSHRLRRRAARAAAPQNPPPAAAVPPVTGGVEIRELPMRAAAPSPEAGVINLVTDLVDPQSAGRREGGVVASRQAVRARPYDRTGTLAIRESLTAAAGRGARAQLRGVMLTPNDLMQHDRSGSARANVLFLVDASASMAAQKRLGVAKSAASALLRSSYQRRDEVALMVFRGEGTELALPFTNDVASIESALAEVPTGGRTPLARALTDAAELLREREPSLLVIFTDGRANVSAHATADALGADPWAEALAACESVRAACAGALVIDCEAGPILLGRARTLADALQAECVALSALESTDLTVRIQRRLEML